MQVYKSVKGSGVYYILGMSILGDLLLGVLLFLIDSYEVLSILKVATIVFNIYQLYYILICSSLKYFVDDDGIQILSVLKLKNIKIPFTSIQGYQKAQGHIRGMKLSGCGKNHFAIGRAIVEKIGSTYMFITSTKNIIYLKTDDINYGLSPENFHEFEKNLNDKNVNCISWEYKVNKNVNLYKDKKFFIPFSIVTVAVLILTLNPIILYFCNKLPAMMPLNFSSHFVVIKFGTSKQFAFKQMVYGLLNMAVLFCMYNAGYLCARYDKKSAYKFIYVPLILTFVFLIMQIRILLTFR
ncbi:PH domain-containing protein [Clostridium sp. JS66]|uniref:PH domain-containing protein n=1 Tax=Clostridium sp. JS66 TaxID=3064705 RepID=UPI00298E9ED0|nr:PH domain-containing protein [Clostridium sp. JS66]WPC42532.1 PH domain-containing protein [Clostridium sp. JS66]